MAKTSLGKVSVLPKGEYSSVIQYSRLDIVTYKGSSYLCIKDSLGIEITNEEYWQLLAQKGDTGETGATGAKGDKGDAGKDFSIYKTYPSISAMESDASNVPEGEFVLIASDVEDTDNAKLYVKSNTGFVYLTDLSGATGIKGEKGDKPINGIDYNTPEEKEEFKNEVVENATVEVEQNIANIQEQAIQEFNSNASIKTNEYNSNTTTKLQEYNTNANTKIEEYNSNATQKTNTFNGNATTQIETFNNNATSKTNDFNSNASTKTEEFNTVVEAEKEEFAGQTEAINHHIAVVSDELERVKNDVLETGEESGSYITLNDSAIAEYQELSVEGVCEQNTTTGKNLLANINGTTQTINGVTFTKNNDGTITVNGTATNDINYYINGYTYTDIEPNTYYLSDKVNNESNNTYFTYYEFKNNDVHNLATYGVKTRTISSKLEGRSRIVVRSGQTLNNVVFKPMLEIGSEETDFEPYTGGQPSPSPDYPQEIKTIENSLKITSCNKNLLNIIDGIYESNGITAIVKDGLITVNGTATANSFVEIPFEYTLLANKEYTLSANNKIVSDSKNGIRFMGEVGTLADFGSVDTKKVIIYSANKKITNLTIRTESRTTYNNFIIKPQLEEGPTATPFEQHLETQITANLPEGEFIGKIDDTYKDTLKVEYDETDGQYHLKLYKKVGKIILDGSENYNITRDNLNNIYFNYTIEKMQKWSKLLSSHFVNVRAWNNSSIKNAIDTSTKAIVIKIKDITTNADFKTWLSSNNVEVYYVLAEPYTVDLGIVDMPLTYDEVTNLFTDSDLMPTINAKYYRNFKKTIEEMQDEIKSKDNLIQNLTKRVEALEKAQIDNVTEDLGGN